MSSRPDSALREVTNGTDREIGVSFDRETSATQVAGYRLQIARRSPALRGATGADVTLCMRSFVIRPDDWKMIRQLFGHGWAKRCANIRISSCVFQVCDAVMAELVIM